MRLAQISAFAFFLMIAFVISPVSVQAQDKPSKREIVQDRIFGREWKKQAKEMSKRVKKESKRMKKEGYSVPPGRLPMESQLSRSYEYQFKMGDDGMPMWIIGEASSVGSTKIAAKNQALENAKLNLAGKLETSIVALVENSIGNEQIDMESAESLTKTVTGSKNIISQKIGRVVTLFEAYKPIGGSNVESSVIIAYNLQTGLDNAKSVIREELKDDANKIHEKLDQILDLD